MTDGDRESDVRRRRARHVPFLRFLAYYVLIVAIAAGLGLLFPEVRDALLAPGVLGEVPPEAGLLTGAETATARELAAAPERGFLDRARTTVVMILAALALALPVAWVYMFTRRLRYDPSLVHSIIILPLAVAGIVIVVKNSLALAFSLAGIVAAVRFRNTLKDPKDAVYIFLVIGIGLSAGVQALDVALVISLAFNLVVLVLWKYNLGAIYTGAGSPTGILGIGDASLHRARTPEERDALCGALREEAEDLGSDGVLLIHAVDAEAARRGVEVSLSGKAKQWRVLDVEPGPDGTELFKVLVRLKKKADPIELLGELEDRWGRHIAAAEYVPFSAA